MDRLQLDIEVSFYIRYCSNAKLITVTQGPILQIYGHTKVER